MPATTTKYLGIYLNDHLAGSTGGLELVKRAIGEHEGTALATFLAELRDEIAEDRHVLEELMDQLGVGADKAKVAVAWASEKAARLKLNGEVRGRSPLTPLVELEALSIGIEGKRLLWLAICRSPRNGSPSSSSGPSTSARASSTTAGPPRGRRSTEPVAPARPGAITRGMRRYPALLWLLVYVGSVIILNGSHGQWDPWELAVGIALPVIACGLAIYLAAGPWPGRPAVRGSYWLLAGTLAFYGVSSLAALFALGIDEAIAVLLAGVIPMTAVAIWLAHVRRRTRVTPDGRLIDESAQDHEDPVPGVGADDLRPLGDSPDLHDDLIPQDLPKDHPSRRAAEAQADAGGGATRGDREERDGARFRRGAPR
jgi:hypothetical protein